MVVVLLVLLVVMWLWWMCWGLRRVVVPWWPWRKVGTAAGFVLSIDRRTQDGSDEETGGVVER